MTPITIWLAVVTLLVLINLMFTLGLLRRTAIAKGTGQGASLQVGLAELRPGQAAPEFQLNSTTGVAVAKRDLDGRRAALLFISPDCDPCLEHLKRFDDAGMSARQHGIEVLFVSLGDDAQTQAMAAKYDVRNRVLMASTETSTMFKDYQVNSTPHLVVLNAEGVIEVSTFPSVVGGAWVELERSWGYSPQREMLSGRSSVTAG